MQKKKKEKRYKEDTCWQQNKEEERDGDRGDNQPFGEKWGGLSLGNRGRGDSTFHQCNTHEQAK